MPKCEQLVIAEEMLWIAKVCITRIASTAYGAIGAEGRTRLAELEVDMRILEVIIFAEKEKNTHG